VSSRGRQSAISSPATTLRQIRHSFGDITYFILPPISKTPDPGNQAEELDRLARQSIK
jgi:hypothetical protein